jgi:hypothetical protein
MYTLFKNYEKVKNPKLLTDAILNFKNISRNAFVIFNPFHVCSALKFAKYADAA